MTVVDILIVVLFLYWGMERYKTNVIAFHVWMLFLCEEGVYLYNALYFGDTWLPKSKSLSRRALQNVLHCPILFLWDATAPVCPLRNVSSCSFSALLEVGANYFRSFRLFLSIFVEGIHFKCGSAGSWCIEIIFFGPFLFFFFILFFFLNCHHA